MHGDSWDILNASTLVALVWVVLEQPWPRLDLDLTSARLMVGQVEVLSLVVWSWALAKALVRVPAQERVRAQAKVRAQVWVLALRVCGWAQVRRLLALVVGLECGAVRMRMLAMWARCACEYRPPCAALVPQAPRVCACGRLVGSAPAEVRVRVVSTLALSM